MNTPSKDIRADVLEIFAEASAAPRSIFADLPYGSVGIEYRRRKRRYKEDPLFRQLRRKKHYKQNRLRLLGNKRNERLRKPEIIARQKARLAAQHAATCEVCDRPIRRANKTGPVAKVCSKRCDNVARARRERNASQTARASAMKGCKCARTTCGKMIERKPGTRGQLPKYCSKKCIGAGKWERYSARKRGQTCPT